MTTRPLLGVVLLFLSLAALPGRAADDWPPKPVRLASKVSGHVHPAACVSAKGTLVVIFSQSDMKDLRLTRSSDGGTNWTRLPSVPDYCQPQ